MSFTIEVAPETERRIRERAARTPESVVNEALEREFPAEPSFGTVSNRDALEAKPREVQVGTPAERAERFLKLVEDIRADIAAVGSVPASAFDKRLAYEDE